MSMTKNIAIILGSFHKQEVTEMLDETRKAAAKADLSIVEEIWVPGSYEKPLALKKMLMQDNVAGAVVLGIIERGETKHGLVMAQTVMPAILRLELEYMKPVGMGILGPEILPGHIQARLRPYARKAVMAVAHMLGQ
jgi:6,7-dimethyl-8-ribityllumazine synthase